MMIFTKIENRWKKGWHFYDRHYTRTEEQKKEWKLNLY